MHLKSDNVEAMTFDNVNKVIKEIFELLISRNQIGLEISTRDGDFILDGVNLIYYITSFIGIKCMCFNVCTRMV